MNRAGDLFQDAAFPWSLIGVALALWFWWAVKDVPQDDWDIVPRIGLASIAYYWMRRIFGGSDQDNWVLVWIPRVLAVALVFILGLAKWSRRS